MASFKIKAKTVRKSPSVKISVNPCYVDPPVGWGFTYCFTDVGIHIRVTSITKGTPAQTFFGEACFLFPRALAFDFCNDLDLCSQGQVVRAFSLDSLILSEEQGGVSSNVSESFKDRWHMT